MLNHERLVRHLLDSLRDCVPVNGLQGDNPQNQGVESPLWEIELCRIRHTYFFYIYTRRYVEGQGFGKMIWKWSKLLPRLLGLVAACVRRIGLWISLFPQ